MYTHKITYDKTFLSGPLNGIKVTTNLNTTDDAVSQHLFNLSTITEKLPRLDGVTLDKFYVSNVRCEEIARVEV